MLRRTVLLALLAGVLAPASARAAVQPVKVGDFSSPVYVTAPPGDAHRLFVVEQGGTIQVLVDGVKQSTPFLNIRSLVGRNGSEQGLLSMAFAPDYATSGKFYVYYSSTNCDGDGCEEHVSEFTRSASNPNSANASERVLLKIPHPTDSNHNGGQLQFGPDGYLYISTGDGGGGNDIHQNAQKVDKSHLLGKILRINPANPSAQVPGNFSGTPIYMYGFRNPWRFSFDRATGDMIIGDVGQSAREEIDFSHPGQNVQGNFGWPCYEGTQTNSAASDYDECKTVLASGTVFPVHEYNHPGGGGAFTGDGIIGGYVVRDSSIPELYGRYIYGDLQTSGTDGLRSLALAQPTATDDRSVPVNVPYLSSFGEDAAGCVYAASVGNGGVWRIAPSTNATPGPCPLAGTPPLAKDTTKPRVTMRLSRRQHILKRHFIKVRVWVNELSTVAGTATVNIHHAARVLRFKRVTHRVAARHHVTLKLKLSKKSFRKLRKALHRRRSFLAKVTVTARDAAGNVGVKRHAVRLVR